MQYEQPYNPVFGLRTQLRCFKVRSYQFLKCLIHEDLIFRADNSESLDADLGEEDGLFEDNVGLSAPEIEKSTSWDDVWLEDEDNEVTGG